MAVTLTIKGGPKDFDCIWDSTLNVPIGLKAASRMNESSPRPLWHQGDGEDGNELVDMAYDDARFPLEVQLGPASDWSTLNQELSLLRRTFRQAAAHAMGEPWADEVYLEGEADGTGSSTYFTIKLAEDRSGGFLWGTQVPNVLFESLALTLTVDGDGYGDEVTLANALRNGHMLIESAAAGLASGFTKSAGVTATLDTDTALIGTQSQKVVTDAADDEYLRTATVTLGAAEYATTYCWTTIPSGDTMYLELYDGSNVLIDSIELIAGNADRSFNNGGTLWYQFSASGTNVDANVYAQVIRRTADESGATTVYVDGFYLETDASAAPAVPAAWAGYPQVYPSRNDPTAANPEYVDRFDVWGIPGDRPAWMYLEFDTGDNDFLDTVWLSNHLDELNGEHFKELAAGGGTARIVNVGCNDGDYIEEVIPGYFTHSDDGQVGAFLLLARCRTSHIDSEFDLRYYTHASATATILDRVTFSVVDRWFIKEVGEVFLNASEFYRDEGGYFGLRVFTYGTALETIHFDWYKFLPAGRFMIFSDLLGDMLGSSDLIKIDGRRRAVVENEAGSEFADLIPAGGLWTLEPGRMNRLVFTSNQADHANAAAESDTADVRTEFAITKFAYRPRTRGFLE